MKEFTEKYYQDLAGIMTGDFDSFYYSVCRFPYGEDKQSEIIARPMFILKMKKIDCKKKSILIASFCKLNRIPCRFIVMSSRPDQMPHHIYTEIYRGGKWVPADATYESNRLGKRGIEETYREVCV